MDRSDAVYIKYQEILMATVPAFDTDESVVEITASKRTINTRFDIRTEKAILPFKPLLIVPKTAPYLIPVTLLNLDLTGLLFDGDEFILQ